jgi:hypothetical protein
MQALAVAGQYRDTRFHNLLRPEPLGIADAIHAAAQPAERPARSGIRLQTTAGARGAALDRFNFSSEASGGEADSENS